MITRGSYWSPFGNLRKKCLTASLPNPTYIGAVRDTSAGSLQALKREKLLTEGCKQRPSQYMNNIIEVASLLSR
jgi:hypothetical protein